ncbi:DNA damage-induced SOS-independent cell division inhibitor A [Caulobacter sp. 1776]|uniref:DNA damage-induced SOS-independent cell division inhibitor A n=1 Tax=Caulobacter sp. 1776 TaxID=3156420 RepID=UPI003393100C
MTDFAMTQPFVQPRRFVRPRFVRPGRPGGVLGAIHYAGVLLVWLALFVVDRPLALKVMAERRADSPIPRRWGW